VQGLPTSILIDAQGKEVERFVGAVDWESNEVADRVYQSFGM
jgi:hypothetical protein